MRSRAYRRTTGNRRKTIGAVVIAGVLVGAGLTGVQLASAETTPKAADVVNVDGQQFDVSKCKQLEINGGSVVCDGKELQPVQQQGADEAALGAAAALEAACDQFAADQDAADGEQGKQEQDKQEQDKQEQGKQEHGKQRKDAEQAAKENEKAAKKWAKSLRAALKEKAKANGNQGKGNDGKGNNGNGNGNGNGNEQENAEQEAANDQAVAEAQQNLLEACLALADAKELAGDADAAEQAGQEADKGKQNGKEHDAEEAGKGNAKK